MTHDQAFEKFQAQRDQARARRGKITWRLRGGVWIGGHQGRAALYAQLADGGFEYGTRDGGRHVKAGSCDRLTEAKRAAEALL